MSSYTYIYPEVGDIVSVREMGEVYIGETVKVNDDGTLWVKTPLIVRQSRRKWKKVNTRDVTVINRKGNDGISQRG